MKSRLVLRILWGLCCLLLLWMVVSDSIQFSKHPRSNVRGIFFFWAFPWDGRALRFKSSPKGCGLYSAIPNAWLKTPLAGGVLLHTASCVLVMLLLNCRFFSVRVWHVCSLVGWLCFRYSDVIIRIFG